MPEPIECEEFGEVSVRLSTLMKDGELIIDERVARKGYLTTAFTGGQIILKSTKFVGTIPLTPEVSVRVRPRANINCLSYMLTRSRKAPTAIAGFARGYSAKFVRADKVEQIFSAGFVQQVAKISRRGLIKRYISPRVTVPWKGRFLAAETVRRHAAKGVRYRHEFDQTVLSPSALDNIALKEAMRIVLRWHKSHDLQNPLLPNVQRLLSDFETVESWTGTRSELVVELRTLLSRPQSLRADYVDALWSAFALLHGSLPDVGVDGSLNLDSLIVNVSEVFEAYVRRELAESLGRKGFKIEDGWKKPKPFFADGSAYSVHPDIIIRRDGEVVAVLDAKYKPEIKETDRYQVVTFMDVMNANLGGFICPTNDAEVTGVMGTTASGKRLFCFRVNLAADDPLAEGRRLSDNVEKMIEGRTDFV